MLTRGMLFGEPTAQPFEGIQVAHLNFSGADGTNINTMTGTNISGIEVESTALLQVEYTTNMDCLTNGAYGVARSTNAVRSTRPMGFYFDVWRGGVDNVGASFLMLVFADSVSPISSLNGVDVEGIGYELWRESSMTLGVNLYVKRPGGEKQVITVGNSIDIAPSSGGRIWFILEGSTVSGWKEDSGGGGTKHPFTPYRVAGDWNDGNHEAVLFRYGTGSNQAGRLFLSNFDWQR